MRFFFIFILLAIGKVFAQPAISTFSPLSGVQGSYITNVAKHSDGYLIQGVYENLFSEPLLFKLNPSGKILDSVFNFYDGKTFHSDQIFPRGNLNYQIGHIFSSKTGVVAPKRGLIILDNNLKVVKKFEYDIVPANGFPSISTSNAMIGDTIISVRSYACYDSLLNPLPCSSDIQIERFGINGEVYDVIDISERVILMTDAVTIKDRIFIFGWVASVGTNINSFPVGEYMLDGTFVKCHPFNIGDPSSPSNGAMAEEHKGFLYHVHDAILDQRDSRFNLIKRVKLRDQDYDFGIVPSHKSFAFDDKDNIFYLNINVNDNSYSVFKLNAKLELLWEKKFERTFGIALFVIETNEGGCVASFIKGEKDSQGKDVIVLKMYKLDDLGNVTSVESIVQPVQRELFYPNPFQSQLTLQQGMEGATEVCLYDMSGRTVGTYTLENNNIKVDDFLPVGTYMAQLKDAQGKILGVQTVVKE